MLNCVSLSHLMVEKIDEDVMGVRCERLVCSYSHSSTVLSDQSSSEQNMMTHSVSHVKSWLSVCKVMTMPWGIHTQTFVNMWFKQLKMFSHLFTGKS